MLDTLLEILTSGGFMVSKSTRRRCSVGLSCHPSPPSSVACRIFMQPGYAPERDPIKLYVLDL